MSVAPQPFFTSRGTPLSVYYRTLVMAEQGASLDVLTYGVGNDVDIQGARVVRIPRVKMLEPVPIGPSWRKLILDILMVTWTIGLLLSNRYDAVDAHEESVFWCRFLKPFFRFKLIYDMHSSLPQQLTNFAFTRSRLLTGAFRWLEDLSLRGSEVVITVCPDLFNYAKDAGVPPGRLVLIENSLFDEVRLRLSASPCASDSSAGMVEFGPGHPVILYAGTFEVYQGVEMLVQAFSQVVKALPNARLLLVGGTSAQVQTIRRLAYTLGLGDTCMTTGNVPRSVATAYTPKASVLVSPRLHGTNTPLKIYEHLASGRPMVATRIWSHTQVLDDSVCRLVEPNSESLAEGLVAAIVDTVGSAARAGKAVELYHREYSRPAYEQKIRWVLETLA